MAKANQNMEGRSPCLKPVVGESSAQHVVDYHHRDVIIVQILESFDNIWVQTLNFQHSKDPGHDKES